MPVVSTHSVMSIRGYSQPSTPAGPFSPSGNFNAPNAGTVGINPISMSDDGNTLVIGAPFTSPSGTTAQGRCYVYTRSGSIYTLDTFFTASDILDNDNFGWSVSMSGDGNTIVVGTPGKESGALTDSGAAYIFTRSGGVWSQSQKITASNASNFAAFGQSISISKDTNYLVVSGAAAKNSVYVFQKSGGTYSEIQILTASTSSFPWQRFGNSLALNNDGTNLVVGAPDYDSTYTDRGGVYLYFLAGSTYTLSTILTGTLSTNGANFGTSVSLSYDGSTLVVGAPGEQIDPLSSGPACGVAYTYARTSSSPLLYNTLIRILGPSIRQTGSQFGGTVVVSGDGNTVIVGGPRYDGQFTDQGLCYSFFRTSLPDFPYSQQLIDPVVNLNSYWGQVIATNNNSNVAVIVDQISFSNNATVFTK